MRTQIWTNPAAIAAPDAGRVAVYRLVLPARRPAMASMWLSAEECERAARFHFEQDRLRFLWGRVSLRHVLGRCLCLSPAEVPISYASSGKPHVSAVCGKLEFNLSHSGQYVLIALAVGRRVGIDVEAIQASRDVDALAEHVFSARESCDYASFPREDRGRVFFAVWARKEAVAKACGLGLGTMLRQVDVPIVRDMVAAGCRLPGDDSQWTIRDLPVDEGYSAALAVEGAECSVDTFALNLEWDG